MTQQVSEKAFKTLFMAYTGVMAEVLAALDEIGFEEVEKWPAFSTLLEILSGQDAEMERARLIANLSEEQMKEGLANAATLDAPLSSETLLLWESMDPVTMLFGSSENMHTLRLGLLKESDENSEAKT